MAKNNSGEKLLGDRKPGELIETFGDFWLGMAGALGRGLSEFSKTRREKKADNEPTDFMTDATAALEVTIEEARRVTGQTKEELIENKQHRE
jgi:hypothetical protein